MRTLTPRSKPVQMSKSPAPVKPRLPFSAKSDQALQKSGPSLSTRFAHDFSQVPLSPETRAEDVHRLARQGTSGGGGSLPYLDRIQQAFGPAHDLSHVKAHAGSAAAESARRMGSEAYATGSSIAFGTTPSLHIAAHEAAHVVQQRSGVQLSGGVGQAGDAYERNADAVAGRVVRGETASDLLPTPQGNGPAQGASVTQRSPVQMYTNVSAGTPYDKMSDDGKMAVLNHGRKGWAESANIARSNKALDTNKSKAKIEEVAGGDISVAPPGAAAGAAKTTLKQFRMIDRATGAEVELEDDCGTACQQSLGSEAAGYEAFVGVTKRGTTEEYTKPSKYEADDNAAGGLVSTTERMSGEIYIRIFDREFSKTLSREDALKEWSKLPADKKKELSQKYGINQFAVPKVGQGVTIGSERDMPGASITGYNFHFGLNLMASGPDYITLEDYASSGAKYYFDMYGPESKSQSWAQAPSNTGALDDKTTTMVVQHPESLKGIINSAGVHFEDDPAAATGKKVLDKDTKVTILRKGQNWMKVEVNSGVRAGQSGWILNQFYTDD